MLLLVSVHGLVESWKNNADYKIVPCLDIDC